MAKGMSVSVSGTKGLEQKLQRMNQVRFDAVVEKQSVQMVDRATASHNPSQGGTPYDKGQLLESVQKSESGGSVEVGYTKEYAPHVEYGHRTRNGGWVPGQHFLQKNVEIQRPIFQQDLLEAIEKEKG